MFDIAIHPFKWKESGLTRLLDLIILLLKRKELKG
jgi:hypothetical protein